MHTSGIFMVTLLSEIWDVRRLKIRYFYGGSQLRFFPPFLWGILESSFPDFLNAHMKKQASVKNGLCATCKIYGCHPLQPKGKNVKKAFVASSGNCLSRGLLQQKLNNETHQRRSLSSVCWDRRRARLFYKVEDVGQRTWAPFPVTCTADLVQARLKPSPHGADTSSNSLYLRHNIQFTPAKGNKQTPTHHTMHRESQKDLSLWKKKSPPPHPDACTHKKSAVRPAAHTSGRRATALLPNKGQIGGWFILFIGVGPSHMCAAHTARYFSRNQFNPRGRGRTRAAVWARSVFLEAGSFLGPPERWFCARRRKCTLVHPPLFALLHCAEEEAERASGRALPPRGSVGPRKISRAKIHACKKRADAAAHLTKERPFWLCWQMQPHIPAATVACILHPFFLSTHSIWLSQKAAFLLENI